MVVMVFCLSCCFYRAASELKYEIIDENLQLMRTDLADKL